MILAWLQRGTRVERLAGVGMGVGLMSAGLGSVPAGQTYLDITQGNRAFDSLYDTRLPSFGANGDCAGWWRAVVERADSAPADIVPGLLASTLRAAGVTTRAVAKTAGDGRDGGGASAGAGGRVVASRSEAGGGGVGGEASCAFSAPEPGTAATAPPKKSSGAPRPTAVRTFEVRSAGLAQLPSLVRGLRGDDLLIAIERPPPAKNRALAIGVAGRGFDGNLTSDSTRLDGYVLSTDVAPTVLRRLGVGVPSAVSGQPVRAERHVDVATVISLGDRMAEVPVRRGPVIGVGLLTWLLALALLVAGTRGRVARPAVGLAALSVVYLPLILLFGAALEPDRGVEQLLTIAGAPLLALLTLATLRGYRALAVASALTVVAYAIDAIAGSPLTALSLLGPNPGLGVRFYGIGNELEAILVVLIVAGTGAALTGFSPRWAPRPAVVFLSVGFALALVFGAGRFGADVGAAIVLPVGSGVAAYLVAARRRRRALLVIAAPLVAVALLALVDLASGANAHLTRSVLDAGGLGNLTDVAQRRLQLSAHSFARPFILAFMPLVVAAVALALAGRRRLASWLRGRPAMRAGLWGALAAILLGTLANDSGAVMLEIGAVYLLAFTGFAWAAVGVTGGSRSID